MFENAEPLLVTFSFSAVTAEFFEVSLASPGLLARSMLIRSAVWKSDCVVSVKHMPAGAAVSAKFCVVEPPSVTATALADAEP